MRPTALLALLLALAAPLAAQEPPKKQLLRLSFQPGSSHFYRLTMGMQTRAKAGNNEVSVDMTMEQVMEMKCVEVKDGKARIELTSLRLILKATGPMKIDYDSDVEGSDPGMLRNAVGMLGETMTMSLDERGRLGDLDVPEAFEALGLFGGGGVEELMAQAMPQLPEAPVAIGESWETSAEMRMGKYGSGQVKIVNRLAAVEGDSLRIDQEMQLDLGKPALPGGGRLQAGKCTGSTLVHPATGSLGEATMDSALTATGGMSMEMVMKTTLRAIDAPPAKKATGKGK
jgi:hypothetical protein